MKKKYIKVDGITCDHCRGKISSVLKDIKNIKKVNVNGNIFDIDYDGTLNTKEIINKINNLDYYTCEEYIVDNKKDLNTKIKLKEFLIILFSFFIIIFILNKIFKYNIFNAIPTIDSNVALGMLFILGLLTSIHCVSMCGAINLMASLKTSKSSFRNPILYNTGRVLSYTILGGLVGLIGSVMQINTYLIGTVILVASLVMLAVSLNNLGIINLKLKEIKYFKVHSKNSFVIGLLNGFMPCGPLQSMMLFALATSSFFKGALAMFLFGLGTVPLMLFMGLMVNVFRGKTKIILNKVAGVMIIIMSIIMLNRGLMYFNIDVASIFENSRYDKMIASEISANYQTVTINLEIDGYKDIVVQKGIPVHFIINATSSNLTNCNREIIISAFAIKKELSIGKNIIEFTPDKVGTYTYTCWMNMLTNKIVVIDDKNYFKKGD